MKVIGVFSLESLVSARKNLVAIVNFRMILILVATVFCVGRLVPCIEKLMPQWIFHTAFQERKHSASDANKISNERQKCA